MEVYLSITDEGYIEAWSSSPFEGEELASLECNHEQLDSIVLGATKLIDGNLVVDEEKRLELFPLESTHEVTKEELKNEIVKLNGMLADFLNRDLDNL